MPEPRRSTFTPQKQPRGPFFWVLSAVAIVFGLPLSLWAYGMWGMETLPGVRIAGFALPKSGSHEKFLRAKARLWAQESLDVQTGYHVWRPTRAELGAGLDVPSALRQIRDVGRSPNPFVVLRALWVSAYGRGHDVRWRPRIMEEEALDSFVRRVQSVVDRLPTAGTLDPNGNVIEGLSGEAIDVEATKQAIRTAIARGQRSIRVATLVTPPMRGVKRFDNPIAETNVLMYQQDTEYRPNSGGRATNIELAARLLNGQIIMPGASFSYNAVVGKRDAARGFAPAAELMNGEVVQGIGGGVCQVAGTLHAAAFFAGLIVEEYRPHSRLNHYAYLRPGLDTMVAWPDHVNELSQTKDMRLRNPYPFPVLIKTSTLKKNPYTAILRVDLYGASKAFQVEFSFEEVGRVPAGEIRRPDPTLARGQERVEQEPLDGLIIMRRRTIYMPTRRVDEETRVAYPATPRVVLIGEA